MRRLLGWLRSRPYGPGRPAKFHLLFVPKTGTPVRVGELTFDGATWRFVYAEEFKKRTDLRPIEGFRDKEGVYTSEVLWPFFTLRVPEQRRRDVKEFLADHKMADPDMVQMLKTFGRRTVASPDLELEYAG